MFSIVFSKPETSGTMRPDFSKTRGQRVGFLFSVIVLSLGILTTASSVGFWVCEALPKNWSEPKTMDIWLLVLSTLSLVAFGASLLGLVMGLGTLLLVYRFKDRSKIRCLIGLGLSLPPLLWILGVKLVTTSPYGFWPMDEVSQGARYTLTTREVTGNGPSAELMGGVVLDANGYSIPCLTFDGSGYVKFTGAGRFLKHGAAKRTIDLWVKASSTSGVKNIYDEGSSTNGFAIRINDGVLQFAAANGGTSKVIGATYTDSSRHRVTAVYNAGAMTLYVDGKSIAAGTAGFSSVAADNDDAAIGGIVGSNAFGVSGTSGSFVGSLDGVRVLNDALRW